VDELLFGVGGLEFGDGTYPGLRPEDGVYFT